MLSYPFRVAPNGVCATVDQQSDAGAAQEIAVLALTRVGERPALPGYGIQDPAFDGVAVGELAAKIALYGPPVELGEVSTVDVDDHTQQVTVTFRR